MKLVEENIILKDNMVNLPGFKEFYEADTVNPKDSLLNFDDFKT